jgi:hypothetical protein
MTISVSQKKSQSDEEVDEHGGMELATNEDRIEVRNLCAFLFKC